MTKLPIRRLVALAAVAVLTPACWGKPAERVPVVHPVVGGTLVLGAEQYPECINPVTQCASAVWLSWSLTQHVLPRAMQMTRNGLFTNSPLLSTAPSLANGGLTLGPFSLRFWINPNAVWSDGTAITCADFDFTWNAILHTKYTFTVSGYDKISGIECPDPRTVILRFRNAYADWAELFGGASGFVLEEAAFPAQAGEAKIDLSREMQDNIPFSGGPWILQSWNKDETVLVPNPRYWVKNPSGRPTYFDQVVIYPRTDQPTEVKSLISGDVWAITSSPTDATVSSPLRADRGIRSVTGVGPDAGAPWEALLFNPSRFPWNDKAVREAFFYAVDREALAKQIVGPVDPSHATPLNCGFLAYPGSFWCDRQAFAQFHYDPAMVSQILASDGWTKNASGYWAKNGVALEVPYQTSFLPRKQKTQELVTANLKAAGFKVTAVPDPCFSLLSCHFFPDAFVENLIDKSLQPGADPSAIETLSCPLIPPIQHPGPGISEWRWCNPDAIALMRQGERELDPVKRRALLDRLFQVEVEDFAPGLPLYVRPNITAWRSDFIAGPVGEWNATSYGGFFNIEQWWCRHSARCVL